MYKPIKYEKLKAGKENLQKVKSKKFRSYCD